MQNTEFCSTIYTAIDAGLPSYPSYHTWLSNNNADVGGAHLSLRSTLLVNIHDVDLRFGLDFQFLLLYTSVLLLLWFFAFL